MSGNGPRLAVITKNRTNPAYAGARLGVDRVGGRLGVAVRHYVPETPDDVDEQRALLEQAIAEAPDAMVVIPAHPTDLNPTFERARSAGIPFFCCVSRMEGIDPVTFVGSDNHALAVAVAERMFAHLGGRGRLAILEGHPNAPTSRPRTDGFNDAAARHPGIEIVDSRRGDFQEKEGREAMEAILVAHSHLDGVLAANDFMAMGALAAMEAAGRSMPIIGINASPDAIAAIRNGRLLATASFDAMKMACIAGEAAVRHLRGEAVPPTIMLPAETVDASNCALWDSHYEDRPLPDWNRETGAAPL